MERVRGGSTILAEKASQWEEDRLAQEEERRKIGRRWADLDGDQLMDVEG